MKKILFTILFVYSLGLYAQNPAPFKNGIKLPNATEQDTLARIPVMAEDGTISGFVFKADIAGGGGDGNGADGLGWTGGSYNGTTGVVTFTSDDGLGFTTGDLRGADGADGEDGEQGPQGVQGIQGEDGPQGIQGIQGVAGNDGADGADGKTVLNGTAAPTGVTGVNGDFYIDTSADEIYGPKTAGAWGSGTSLVGPAGADGADGQDGAGASYSFDSPLSESGGTVTIDESGITITESQISDLSHTVDTDTQLSDAEVKTAIDSEYPDLDTDSTDDFDGDYENLTNKPTITDDQALSQSGNTVTLEDGGSVNISTTTAVAANTAKISNATHTGDVTGSGALTIATNAVTNTKIAANAVTVSKIADGSVNIAKVTSSVATSIGLANTSLQTSQRIDDDTFATATATNIPSAESVKSYVEGSILVPIERPLETFTASRNLIAADLLKKIYNTAPATLTITENFGAMDIGGVQQLIIDGSILTVSAVSGVTLDEVNGGSVPLGNNSATISAFILKIGANSYKIL